MARQTLPGLFGRGRPDLFLDPFFSLRSEIDRLFEDFGRAPALRAAVAPKIDVSETEQTIEIHAELPGVSEGDLDLSVEENAILLRGERREQREERQRNWHVQERSFGAFARRIELPFAPNPEEVRARFENGVLFLTIPKPLEAKKSAQRIRIEGAQRTVSGAGPSGAANELGEGAAPSSSTPQAGGGGPG